MTLAAGARLGPNEKVAPIGESGIGVVYCARDPRLDRQVAIKLLLSEMAADQHARERPASKQWRLPLDHPYICKIFEIGEDGDDVFLCDGIS
jgi:eukaryotic-like serine/threonine-protein kinase